MKILNLELNWKVFLGVILLLGMIGYLENTVDPKDRAPSSTNNNIFGSSNSIKIDSKESCADLQIATYGITEYNEVREYICYDRFIGTCRSVMLEVPGFEMNSSVR